MTEIWTASRVKTLATCPQLHHLRYVLGLQAPPTAVMRFGTAGHQALEAYFFEWMNGSGRTETRLGAATDPEVGALAGQPLDHVDQIKLRVLVAAYHTRWGHADWEVLEVEREFAFDLGNRVVAGKMDAIIRDRPSGLLYVVEHKTTGSDTSLGGPYWDRLAIDTQVSTYVDGAAMLGYDVAGVIYDVLKRPAHEPLLATPAEARKYTQGRGCKACGGGAGEEGSGVYHVHGPGDRYVMNTCLPCGGTGWIKTPQLYANQRDRDETPGEFEDRLTEAVIANPSAFVQRHVVVRLEDEMPRRRQDLLDWIALGETGLAPRNDGACVRAGQTCAFFDLCAGRVTEDVFARGPIHQELSLATDTDTQANQ